MNKKYHISKANQRIMSMTQKTLKFNNYVDDGRQAHVHTWIYI